MMAGCFFRVPDDSLLVLYCASDVNLWDITILSQLVCATDQLITISCDVHLTAMSVIWCYWWQSVLVCAADKKVLIAHSWVPQLSDANWWSDTHFLRTHAVGFEAYLFIWPTCVSLIYLTDHSGKEPYRQVDMDREIRLGSLCSEMVRILAPE